MTNSVCVIFASFQPGVQSFGALAQSTNSPPVQILASDFKSLRLRARHAFGTFGEYRTRQKDYDRASASKSDYWVRNPKCSLAFHRARACKRVVWVIAERIFPGCLARCIVSYAFAQAESVGARRFGQPAAAIAISTQATLCSAGTSTGAGGGDDDDDGRGGRQERGVADVGGRSRVQAGSANLPW